MSKNTVQLSRDAKKKKIFLKHLMVSSHIAASARVARIPISTLYSWREKDKDFYADWLKALAIGYELLEVEMLVRLREGVDKKIFHRGALVAEVKEFDNGSALRLLALHKDTIAKERAAQLNADANDEAMRADLANKIELMHDRMQRRGAFDGDNLINYLPDQSRSSDSE